MLSYPRSEALSSGNWVALATRRLGRSTRQLIELGKELGKKGIHLVALNDPIDTPSLWGVLLFPIFCALAEYERTMIVQRTRAALESG